jgi:oxygen-independent coproporphyrinogen-3 oxidase
MNFFEKYNIAAPRYTSYPTVPYWDIAHFSKAKAVAHIRKHVSNNSELSLYIHLPFCERLCTFCGCHKYITKRHEVETPYINAVLKEWNLYLNIFKDKPVLKEMHLGGGTPTFFSPKSLEKLMEGILSTVKVAPNFEFGFEGHPHSTTLTHLEVLKSYGFSRVSFGVQDYNEHIQKAINRFQSFYDVAKVSFIAREIGYKSISHDLVYGLPFQSEADIIDSIEKTTILKPDRISLYSYAHVPWVKGTGQRGFQETDLPQGEIKRKLYEIARELLLENDYHEIGMDHFALANDDLYKQSIAGTLHRNFMGYTTAPSIVQLGLGVSAISNSGVAFSQNTKTLKDYYQILSTNDFPIQKGHLLSDEDQYMQQHILNIMCKLETKWDDNLLKYIDFKTLSDKLASFVADKLVVLSPNNLQVTEAGRPFIRNICMAFDLQLHRKTPETKLFSSAI